MSGAYWVVAYRGVSDQSKLDAYAAVSRAAIEAAGGRVIARGLPAHTYEAGLNQRTVVIEFPSVEAALAAHDSPAYQQALALLGDGAERDIRVVPGV